MPNFFLFLFFQSGTVVTKAINHFCVCDHICVCDAAHQAALSFSMSWSFLKFMSIESVMQSNHLILSCPLLLLPSIFHSISIFSSELALCIRWPKYWSFSISLSNEYSGLVGSPCSPRDSQESSPGPQFKSINSLALSLFYCIRKLLISQFYYERKWWQEC